MLQKTIKHILIFLTCCIAQTLLAQGSFAPLNADYNYLIDRAEIKNGALFPNHSSFKPYERANIASFIEQINTDSTLVKSKQDQFNNTYLLNDNWEFATQNVESKKTFLKQFYTKPNAMYEFHNQDFEVQANPVFNFQGGKESSVDGYKYINTKGIEVRGMINKKVGFYTFLTDNQVNYASYVNQHIAQYGAVPGEGFHKDFKITAQDFIAARGYITFNATKNIHVQFGHDKNFVGNGMRSLILSDVGNSYLFLKFTTNVWKLKYTNLFAQMNAMGANGFGANALYPRKYFALHHLSYNVTKNFNFGLFESIVFGRSDSLQQGSFDFNYFNPIIFYRWAEQQNGSPDNANIGLDFKWNMFKHISLYGQLFIDEFILSNIKAGNGSWTNKQGIQLGLKAIDICNISTLDLQLETNIVRPYTYAHASNYTNYTHYGQALAHPYGANFNEMIAILRYQPFPKLQLIGKMIYAKIGEDPNLTDLGAGNYGGNIFKSYSQISATHEFNNTIGQGISSKLMYLSATASYMLRHNLFIDAELIARNYSNSLVNNKALIANLGLRLNIARRVQEF